MSKTYLFFDFETNGLKAFGYDEHPTQLCFIVTNSTGKIIHTYNELIKGTTRLSPWVIENCPHVSLQALSDNGVSVKEAWTSLLSYAGPNTLFVAHNLSFDWGIVEKYAKQLLVPKGYNLLQLQPRFCTKEMSTDKCKIQRAGKSRVWGGGYKWPTLEELAGKLDVNITGALHDALTDVRVLRSCFWEGRRRLWW